MTETEEYELAPDSVFRKDGLIWEEIPKEYDFGGHVVRFREPLLIYEFPPEEKLPDGTIRTSMRPTDKLRFKTHYMLVTGGFGAYHECSGTMILGYFAPTPQDCINRTNGQGGNTRSFPMWQSKDVYPFPHRT